MLKQCRLIRDRVVLPTTFYSSKNALLLKAQMTRSSLIERGLGKGLLVISFQKILFHLSHIFIQAAGLEMDEENQPEPALKPVSHDEASCFIFLKTENKKYIYLFQDKTNYIFNTYFNLIIHNLISALVHLFQCIKVFNLHRWFLLVPPGPLPHLVHRGFLHPWNIKNKSLGNYS